MPVLYLPEVCRSDYHTFEVPTERKLFHTRFESPPFPASFLSHRVKISINTEQSELRFLPSTLLKYVAPTTIHLKFRLSGSYSTCALEAHLFPLFSLSNPDKIPINTAPPEIRCLSCTFLKYVAPTTILLKFRLSGSYSTSAFSPITQGYITCVPQSCTLLKMSLRLPYF